MSKKRRAVGPPPPPPVSAPGFADAAVVRSSAPPPPPPVSAPGFKEAKVVGNGYTPHSASSPPPPPTTTAAGFDESPVVGGLDETDSDIEANYIEGMQDSKPDPTPIDGLGSFRARAGLSRVVEFRKVEDIAGFAVCNVGIPGDTSTVVLVSGVEKGGPAARAGVRRDDWLLEVNGVDVSSSTAEEVRQLASRAHTLELVLASTVPEDENESDEDSKERTSRQPAVAVDPGTPYGWKSDALELDDAVARMRVRRAQLLELDVRLQSSPISCPLAHAGPTSLLFVVPIPIASRVRPSYVEIPLQQMVDNPTLCTEWVALISSLDVALRSVLGADDEPEPASTAARTRSATLVAPQPEHVDVRPRSATSAQPNAVQQQHGSTLDNATALEDENAALKEAMVHLSERLKTERLMAKCLSMHEELVALRERLAASEEKVSMLQARMKKRTDMAVIKVQSLYDEIALKDAKLAALGYRSDDDEIISDDSCGDDESGEQDDGENARINEWAAKISSDGAAPHESLLSPAKPPKPPELGKASKPVAASKPSVGSELIGSIRVLPTAMRPNATKGVLETSNSGQDLDLPHTGTIPRMNRIGGPAGKRPLSRDSSTKSASSKTVLVPEVTPTEQMPVLAHARTTHLDAENKHEVLLADVPKNDRRPSLMSSLMPTALQPKTSDEEDSDDWDEENDELYSGANESIATQAAVSGGSIVSNEAAVARQIDHSKKTEITGECVAASQHYEVERSATAARQRSERTESLTNVSQIMHHRTQATTRERCEDVGASGNIQIHSGGIEISETGKSAKEAAAGLCPCKPEQGMRGLVLPFALERKLQGLQEEYLASAKEDWMEENPGVDADDSQEWKVERAEVLEEFYYEVRKPLEVEHAAEYAATSARNQELPKKAAKPLSVEEQDEWSDGNGVTQSGDRSNAGLVDEARRISQQHQRWMINTLSAAGGSCSYGHLVEVGEEKECDTVGAMLKILKDRKVISFSEMFLMYPMHRDEKITLIDAKFDPVCSEQA